MRSIENDVIYRTPEEARETWVQGRKNTIKRLMLQHIDYIDYQTMFVFHNPEAREELFIQTYRWPGTPEDPFANSDYWAVQFGKRKEGGCNFFIRSINLEELVQLFNKEIEPPPLAEYMKIEVPNRWSMWWDNCVECHSDESRHQSNGLCNNCYSRMNYHNERREAQD